MPRRRPITPQVFLPMSLDPQQEAEPRRPNLEYLWEEIKFVLENVLTDSCRRNARRGGPTAGSTLLEAARLQSQSVTSSPRKLLPRPQRRAGEAVVEFARHLGLEDSADAPSVIACL